MNIDISERFRLTKNAFGKFIYSKLSHFPGQTEITAVGIRHADHVPPSILKRWH
jgi:hypothetical protein